MGTSAAHADTESVTDTPSVVPIDVDRTTILREFAVTIEGEVEKVTIAVDVLFHDQGLCSEDVGTGLRWPEELGLELIAPSGAQAALVYSNSGTHPRTFNIDSNSIDGRYVIVFDDDAAELVGTTNSGLPTSGTFRPEEPLSVFQGETAAGVWQLSIQDTAGSDPKCYFGATLNVETATADEEVPDESDQAPTPPARISTAAQ